MNTSLLISAGALQSFQQKLDSVSNNIANVNTTGYKRREASFSEILASQINNQGLQQPGQEEGRLTPDGIREGYGSRLGLTQLEMEQGQPIKTENPLDFMIKGKGFFQVGYKEKNGSYDFRYTRDGSFHLSPNPEPQKPGTYHVVSQNGAYLLDQKGVPIVLDGSGKGVPILSANQIPIVNISNPDLLQNVGNNEFEIDSTVLPTGTSPKDYVRVMQPSETQIQSGFLEGSNVDLTKEMTDLMTSQRGFQMNARAVSYADQMMGIANSILK